MAGGQDALPEPDTGCDGESGKPKPIEIQMPPI